METAFAWAMAGAASAHQAATASREQNSQQRAVRTRRTSADPQRAQQGATAAAAAAPAALDSLSRLQQLADASPQVAQLRRLQALADGHYAPVAQFAGGSEEEELVQGKFAAAQLQSQLRQAPRANNTGLPDQLKSGIESLSGLSLDHVRVHYNSSQPAQLNALAYAQGSDIHLAPGQQHHLPHEAWHVVQQAQGRVRPTMQMKEGVLVNDDVGLEREADVMGGRALEGGHRVHETHRPISKPIATAQPTEGGTTNSPNVKVANNDSTPLANGRGSAQRGGNEVQRIADQRPEAALQRQVQVWGDGSERVGKLRVWQGVADGRGVGGKRQDLTTGFARMAAATAQRQGVRQLMTVEAARAAQVGQAWVWVREDGEGPWQRGRVQDVEGNGTVTVDVGEGLTVTALADELRESPPPDAPLDRRLLTLAVVDHGPGTVAASSSADASSPEVMQYIVLLAAHGEAQRKQRMRELLLALHPDKGGDGKQFKSLKIAIDVLKNGPPPVVTREAPLALTYGDMGPGRALEPSHPHLPRASVPGQPLVQAPQLDVPRVEIPKELRGQPFSEAEASQLGTLGQVQGPPDLARLASTGRVARDLLALAGLHSAATLGDLVALAALPQPVATLARLETLPHVANAADLLAVANSGHGFARLAALAGLPQVISRATLLQVAAIPQPEADVATVASIAQAANLVDLQTLCGQLGARTAADIAAIAAIGSPTFAAPNAGQVVQLCGLAKTAAQIGVLAAQPGIANTVNLLTLVNETLDRDTSGDTWHELSDRWETIQRTWGGRWPLTGVFAAVPIAWAVASQRVRAFVRLRDTPASAAELQAFAVEAAAMKSSLDLIDQMSPALDQGRQALADARARLQGLVVLITEIDNHVLQFYAHGTAAFATATLQRLLAHNAHTALTAECNQLLLDQAAYAGLGSLTPALVLQAVLAQQAHTANIAAQPLAATLNGPLAALRTADYIDRTTYTNMNLTEAVVAHGFWQSLRPVEKARFNTKLQGFPVTAWGTQGYPATRARQHGYAGQIQVPTLAGFPVNVGGEVVHDWIFPSPGHGRSARDMNVMLVHALAGTHLPSRLGPLAPDNQIYANRTVYGFRNIAANIVVTNAGTLITFYSTL
jgi:hypothetical protein